MEDDALVPESSPPVEDSPGEPSAAVAGPDAGAPVSTGNEGPSPDGVESLNAGLAADRSSTPLTGLAADISALEARDGSTSLFKDLADDVAALQALGDGVILSPRMTSSLQPRLLATGAEGGQDAEDRKVHDGSWRDAIKRDWKELRLAPLDVRGDREIVLIAVEQSADALMHATDELRAEKAFVLDAVKRQGQAFQYASEALRDDKEATLAAIEQDYLALRHASEKIRSDVDVVIEAMRRAGHTHQCNALDLKVPLEVVREATNALDPARWRDKVARDWAKLALAPFEVRSNKEVVLQAVNDSWGRALEFASPELCADKEIVLAAVAWRGEALQFASEELRSDHDVALQAIQQTWSALRYISQDLRADRAIALEALGQSTDSLELLAQDLRGDRELMLRAVRLDGHALRYASSKLCEDEEVVFQASKNDWMALKHVPEEVRASVAGKYQQEVRQICNLSQAQPTRWLDCPDPPKPTELVIGQALAVEAT